MRAASLVLVLTGCVFTRPIPAGEGQLSQEARERLAKETKAAEVDATTRACKTAATKPDNLRMQRKCLALATTYREVSDARKADSTLDVKSLAEPARATAAASCDARVDAAKFDATVGNDERAIQLFEATVRECNQPEAAITAAWSYRRIKRCDGLVKLAAVAWPNLAKDKWIDLMDAVALCSDDVTLRANLAFVPADVRDDYFLLREKREADERERERRYRAEEARQAAASSCNFSCSDAVSQCRGGCFGLGDACYSQCESLGSMCRSGCY